MLSPEIYSSWENIQNKKYKEIQKAFDLRIIEKGMTLDIGSGNGYFENFLEKNGMNTENIVCLEKNKKMLGNQKNLVLGDGNNLPFKDNFFHTIICIDTIHLIKNKQEIKRVLKKNGIFIVTLFCNDRNKDKKRESLVKDFSEMRLIYEDIFNLKEKEIFMVFEK